MKIAQITDLHISLDNANRFGVDLRRNFIDILQAAQESSPDLIVLTGDLCFDQADAAVYRWIKTCLDAVGVPYVVIGGNHDDSSVLARSFQTEHLLRKGELYFHRHIEGHELFFLETSRGFVSPQQLEWLTQELSELNRDAIVFMHHPPLTGGVPYMDLHYPLKNRWDIQALFFAFPHAVSVFCGHYHAEKTLRCRNLGVHITPSTYFQIDWRQEEFRVDHLRIAFREIRLRQDGVVESTVVYRDGNSIHPLHSTNKQ
jgi:Icc protein